MELPFKSLKKIWHPKMICGRSFSYNLGYKFVLFLILRIYYKRGLC